MHEREVLGRLAKAGLSIDAAAAAWRDSAPLLAALEALGRDGAVAVVKVDGQRDNGKVYTVVVSGGRLGGDVFRKDGSDLRSLLSEALSLYADRVRAS